MIKNDTIVSTTDGRLTLLQWLNKVEDALKNASATAVKVVPQADGKVVFEIDFADGSTISSEPFEVGGLPDGYAVDGAGNVTIAGALKANNNGDVEVNKNLNVDGNATFSDKNSFIWHGTITETLEGMTITSNVSGLFFQGPTATMNGETIYKPAIFALVGAMDNDGFNCYLINPLHYDPDTQEARPATAEEILSGNWSFFMSLNEGKLLINNMSDATLNTLDVNHLSVSGVLPAIDEFFKVTNKNMTLGEIADEAKKVDWKSDAKYQHTVHLITYSDENAQLNVSFTAMSTKNTPVDTYQNLHEVFGGCNLALSGLIKYQSALIPVYIDLHGGTIETDKIYAVDPSNPGAYRPQTLSTFPNITFTDDVVMPK